VLVEGTYEYQDFTTIPNLPLDANEIRFSTAAAKYRVSRYAFGVLYQRPFNAEHGPGGIFRVAVDEGLDVWTGAAAIEVSPGARVGVSFSALDAWRSDIDRWAYQSGVGMELELQRVVLAAAFKSELFGEDAEALLAPSWLEIDARVPLGPDWALGARLGGGWWNDTRGGRLQSPFDAGVGAAWQARGSLRVLGGVHHVRERVDCGGGVICPEELDRDQGTFLDAGVIVQHSMFAASLAVEDSHVFGVTAPSTHVTLSAHVGRP
jgi:hypothetical protein